MRARWQRGLGPRQVVETAESRRLRLQSERDRHQPGRKSVSPLLDKEAALTARVYPDVNTSSASINPANEPIHRQGQGVTSVDQLSSTVLLGLAVLGAVAADLLLWLAAHHRHCRLIRQPRSP